MCCAVINKTIGSGYLSKFLLKAYKEKLKLLIYTKVKKYFEWNIIVSTNPTLIPESLFASASPILASLLTCAVLAIPRACRYPCNKYTVYAYYIDIDLSSCLTHQTVYMKV